MLYREIIAVCSQIHTKHINILCGQNVDRLNVTPGGSYSNHYNLYLNGLTSIFSTAFPAVTFEVCPRQSLKLQAAEI